MGTDVESKLKDLPDKYLIIIAQLLAGHINDSDTFDAFNRPILKPSIRNIYWLFIIQYAVLAFLGIISNIAIIAYTMYNKLYKDITHAFIVNLALCHFVQCAIVLPITLTVMLIQNWIFGQFLCFFLPLLQDIPLHVAMLSHILIAWDRMRWLGDPLRGRLPAFVCCCATWLTGMVIALPYPIYTIYLELGDYMPRLNGVGLCLVNLVDDMHEYMRGLFVIMYCGPTILLAYLYIRTSRELRPPDGPFAVMMFEHRADVRSRQRNSSTSSADRPGRTNSARSYDLYNAELDVSREKRTQRNLGSMAATQVLCVCPLMILRLAKMVLVETYENSSHFDFTYLMFVWIAFLPTVIFPCIYVSEILPRTEKERLRGYFRLSSKRLRKSLNSQEESIERNNSTSSASKGNKRTSTSTTETHFRDENISTNDAQKQKIKLKGKKGTVYNTGNANNNNLIHPPAIRRISESINNSCSNITSSTYCNNGTEQGSIDFENSSVLSIENDSLFEKKWVNPGIQHIQTYSDCGSSFTRNDSSSTLYRDTEAADLLDQDAVERDKRAEIARTHNVSGMERRKLPDIERISKSPKPDIFKYDDNFECPPPYIQHFHHKRLGRKSSHEFSRRSKRNSLSATNDEIIGVGVGVGIGAGVFGDRELSKCPLEGRIRRSGRSSISSGRSSTKSRDFNSPHQELDFRENIFADL